MSTVTVITEKPATVPGRVDGDRILVDESDLEEATGWMRKPQGLCRGEVCVPVVEPELLGDGTEIDLGALADTVGLRSVVAPDAAMVALSLDAGVRRGARRRFEGS